MDDTIFKLQVERQKIQSTALSNWLTHMSDDITENIQQGVCHSIVVKALCYKPEGRGFETR
jgi:hypothetical protein